MPYVATVFFHRQRRFAARILSDTKSTWKCLWIVAWSPAERQVFSASSCFGRDAVRWVSGVAGSSLESSSRLCVFSCGGKLTFVGTQRAINNLARLVYEGIQMCLTTKAFRINLVDVLGSRGPGSKPSTSRGDF